MHLECKSKFIGRKCYNAIPPSLKYELKSYWFRRKGIALSGIGFDRLVAIYWKILLHFSSIDLVTLFYIKLDQGALGMSNPSGPLQLTLKPNSASSINCPLSNFFFCKHWSVVLFQVYQSQSMLDRRGSTRPSVILVTLVTLQSLQSLQSLQRQRFRCRLRAI